MQDILKNEAEAQCDTVVSNQFSQKKQCWRLEIALYSRFWLFLRAFIYCFFRYIYWPWLSECH